MVQSISGLARFRGPLSFAYSREVETTMPEFLFLLQQQPQPDEDALATFSNKKRKTTTTTTQIMEATDGFKWAPF